jgi:hypothetical protein
MVEMVGSQWKTYSLTRQQYYQESGIRRANIRAHAWNKGVRSEIGNMSKVSTKGHSLSAFLEFMEAWKVNKDALWKEYTKMRWNDSRFKLYGGKKRVFATFLNKLQADTNTVIAFGSAKFAASGKGEVAVPTTRAFKECSYRFPIKLVDEFRTSKLFWKDEHLLQLVTKKNKDPAKKDVPVHGLLWCCSTNEAYANKFVDRDVNAAKNIYKCATSPVRPRALDRKFAQGKLRQTVGRVLLS